MDARVKELPQPLRRARDGIGPRDAERVEAKGAGLFG
jgi:hypothetical protein